MIAIRLLLICLLLYPALAGCRASYPTGSVEDTIRELCEKEYGVGVRVATRGKTIGALVEAEGILLSDMTFSDQALKKIEDVMLTTSRVTLSAEFPYDFFVVTILDPKTGVEVSFIRYIKDIRRLIMDDISRNDYFQRLLIEAQSPQPGEREQPFAYSVQERELSEFIAQQIAERVRLKFQMNLIIERLFHISGIKGLFVPDKRFAQDGEIQLILFFDPEDIKFESIGTPELREDFQKALFNTARKVIRAYEFKNYSGLAVRDGSGRQLAYWDSSEFSKGSMNTLMELIRNMKEKGK